MLSTALHALVLFGVTFLPHADHRRPAVYSVLDIVLVGGPSEEPPKKADYLADRHRQGTTQPTEVEPHSVPQPIPPIVEPAEQKPTAHPEAMLSAPAARLRASAAPTTGLKEQSAPDASREEKPTRSAANISASELIARSLDPSNLDSVVARSITAYKDRPREKFISARTREHAYAAYMDAWRLKVERIGNLNYPEDARRQGLTGELVLDVALGPDGAVRNITLLRSSGTAVLDEAAARIVRLASPFAPFPEHIRNETDVLHITRTWRFERDSLASR